MIGNSRWERGKTSMWYVLIAVSIFVADFIIKNRIEGVERPKEKYICNNKLIIRKYHNRGAFLNFLEKKRKIVSVLSFLLVIVVGILFFATLTTAGKPLLKVGLSFLLGGAFNNTYDRLKRKYVVDYVSFNVGKGNFANVVFNISDFFILIGAMLVVLAAL